MTTPCGREIYSGLYAVWAGVPSFCAEGLPHQGPCGLRNRVTWSSEGLYLVVFTWVWPISQHCLSCRRLSRHLQLPSQWSMTAERA